MGLRLALARRPSSRAGPVLRQPEPALLRRSAGRDCVWPAVSPGRVSRGSRNLPTLCAPKSQPIVVTKVVRGQYNQFRSARFPMTGRVSRS